MLDKAFSLLQMIFLNVLNMSFVAVWITAAVILLRFALKKAPKRVRCFLWLLVGVRLVCPFSIESIFSLVPSSDVIRTDPDFYSGTVTHHAITTGIDELNLTVNPIISSAVASANEKNALGVTGIAAIVWLCGIVAVLVYAVVSYILLKRRVRVNVEYEKGAYLCDKIESPFVLGVFRPKIYLPSELDDNRRTFALAHERAHIKRHDNLWKPLAFLLFAVYWFDPLCVISYVLICRDIELACDEMVIKDFDLQKKKAYSQALLDLSCEKHSIRACPLAFGEVGVKERIKSVLSYKRPAFWIIAAALVSCIIVAVCFGTNPKRQTGSDSISENSAVKVIETTSEQSDVSLSCASAELEEGNELRLTLLWKNASDREAECGEKFDLYYFNEDRKKFEQLSPFKSSFYNALGYLVTEKEGSTPGELSLDLLPSTTYDMTRIGRYRLVTAFNFSDDRSKQYEASVTFELKKPSAAVKTVSSNNDFETQGGSRTLTIEDVVNLSKKSNLSVADFSNYAYYETGSGIHIQCYPIDELFSVYIGFTSSEKPYYINLSSDFGSVSLKGADVGAFVAEMKALTGAVDSAVKNYFLENGVVKAVTAGGTSVGFAYSVLDCKTKQDETVAYLKTMAGEYMFYSGRQDVRYQHECLPAVLLFKKKADGTYKIKEYETPKMESYKADVEKLFPSELAENLLAERDYSEELDSSCRESAWLACCSVEYTYDGESYYTLKLDENGVFNLSVRSKGERFSYSGTYKEDDNTLVLTDVKGSAMTFKRTVSTLIYDKAQSSLFDSASVKDAIALPDGASFVINRDIPVIV